MKLVATLMVVSLLTVPAALFADADTPGSSTNSDALGDIPNGPDKITFTNVHSEKEVTVAQKVFLTDAHQSDDHPFEL